MSHPNCKTRESSVESDAFRVKAFDAELDLSTRLFLEDGAKKSICLVCGKKVLRKRDKSYHESRIQHLNEAHHFHMKGLVRGICNNRFPEITKKFKNAAHDARMNELFAEWKAEKEKAAVLPYVYVTEVKNWNDVRKGDRLLFHKVCSSPPDNLDHYNTLLVLDVLSKKAVKITLSRRSDNQSFELTIDEFLEQHAADYVYRQFEGRLTTQ